MKLPLIIAAASLFAVMAVPNLADAACGGSSKAKRSADMSDCKDVFAELNLTAEQQAQLDEVQAACKAEGKTEEACESATKKIRQILTAEQYDQLLTKCGDKPSKKRGSCE
ncbi:MAG: hypothetical protein M5U15_03180 [Kiritimatiellae bacterium]|nr:hypothetical protein [Kiritimatiellia bacterium]